MSLDIYLYGETKIVTCYCAECGNEHTREKTEELYWANITHNLGKMADAAGIYKALWRPEEINATKASDIIPLLQNGLAELKNNPKYYKKFNSENGWGIYEHFVPFVEKYLNACIENPNATIYVSR